MESEPLLGRPTRGVAVDEKPVNKLPYYWPCLATGVALNALALCLSVKLTESLLASPDTAAYLQHNWWIVWLVGLVLLLGALVRPRRSARAVVFAQTCNCSPSPNALPLVALPVYIFTAIVVAALRALLGPQGAFPAWTVLILLSAANGTVFYGLFNATYPFSFFLQIQVYSVFTGFSLVAYTLGAFVLQVVPFFGGGFNTFAAWCVSLAGSIVAYTHMAQVFGYLGYPLSRTVGAGLWHPWVALLLVLLFLNLGAIENGASIGAAARFFEPDGGPSVVGVTGGAFA